YEWDLDGDGNFETKGRVVTFSALKIDGPATLTISVRATDPGGLSDTNTATVKVLNVAPSPTLLTLSSTSIFENGTETLSGTFTDPGVADTHTVVINWGDGTTDSLPVLAVGSFSFSATHRYLD